MRISTSMIYDQNVGSIQRLQGDLFKTQQQLATGRRVLTPSDDPVSSARALEVSQSLSVTEQQKNAIDSAKTSLTQEESTLSGVTNLIQDLQVTTINAGNPALSANERKSLAEEVRGKYQQLLGLANTRDPNGQYLFSGYQGGTQPFLETSPGTVAYQGDQGQRLLQVGTARQIPTNDAGDEVFARIKNGNGVFAVRAGAANAGSAVVADQVLLNQSSWINGSGNVTVRFSVAGGNTTYDIVDTATGKSLLTGTAAAASGPYPRGYTDGTAVNLKSQGTEPAFDLGASITIQGTPADGDAFTVADSTNVSLFKTVNDLATTLDTASGAALANGLKTALQNLNNSLDGILSVRASVGTRLKELDTLESAGEDQKVQYQKTLSNLQDLDYAKAASDLSKQQIILEAAQSSFVKVSQLSLFKFL